MRVRTRCSVERILGYMGGLSGNRTNVSMDVRERCVLILLVVSYVFCAFRVLVSLVVEYGRRGVSYVTLILAGCDGEARFVVFNQKAEWIRAHIKRGDRIQLAVNVTLSDELEAASPLRLQFVLPFNGSVRKIEGGPSGGRFHGRTLADLLECTDSASRVSDVVGVVLAVGVVDIKKRKRDNKDVILSHMTFGCMSMNAVVITLWGEHARVFAGMEGVVCALKGVCFTQTDGDGLVGDLGYSGSVFLSDDIGPGKLIDSEASVAKFRAVCTWYEKMTPTSESFVQRSRVWVLPPAVRPVIAVSGVKRVRIDGRDVFHLPCVAPGVDSVLSHHRRSGRITDELPASAVQTYYEYRPILLLKFSQLWAQTVIVSRQNMETAVARVAVARCDELCGELESVIFVMFDAGVPHDFLQVLADDDAVDFSDGQRICFLGQLRNATLKHLTRGRVAAVPVVALWKRLEVVVRSLVARLHG